jgi:Leucine-rich repeat (LRR) protein
MEKLCTGEFRMTSEFSEVDHRNQLTSLPTLPTCTNLQCSNNQLTSLPPLEIIEKLISWGLI